MVVLVLVLVSSSSISSFARPWCRLPGVEDKSPKEDLGDAEDLGCANGDEHFLSSPDDHFPY